MSDTFGIADRLGFLLGRWRGSGWIVVGGRTVEFDQAEVVRPVLGRGRSRWRGDPGEDALVHLSPDPRHHLIQS